MAKVIITNQPIIVNQHSFENEVGLSSYDLALIASAKVIKKKSTSKNFLCTTFVV